MLIQTLFFLKWIQSFLSKTDTDIFIDSNMKIIVKQILFSITGYMGILCYCFGKLAQASFLKATLVNLTIKLSSEVWGKINNLLN